ncbi:MAG: hypothetical protein ABJA71_17315 [Ginsengibacter sp.]
MRRVKLITVFFCSIILSCCHGRNYARAENALDGGREFIDGCLKGDFSKASFYMLDDSRNKELLQTQQKNYNAKSREEKQQYHDASIIIIEDATINDSTHIINYQNSYDKIGRKVKVILHDNDWLVDFKYTFNGNL